MNRFALLISTAILTLTGIQTYAAPRYIIILRHGEKISDSSRHLSPQGYRRADALSTELQSRRFTSKYGAPAALFAASDRGGRSKRSIETLQPTAKALKLEIDKSFSKGEEHELIDYIKDNKALDDKTVIISWAHAGIPDFLKEFDIDGPKKKKWGNNTFDEFWILKNLPKGKWKFDKVDQALLPSDDGYCAAKLLGRTRNAPRPPKR